MAKETATTNSTPTLYDPTPDAGQDRPNLPVAEQMFRSQGRVITAQNVQKPRSEPAVLQKLKSSAASAGEKYFYMLPFKGSDGRTNVMGPSVKLCSDAARMWGNCEVDCRFAEETPTHFIFDATFIDHETGYVLHRPFLQRKDQNVGQKDKSRGLDQIFQIAASKATRNVIHRALPELVDQAYEVAVKSLADTVGKNAAMYRERISSFLEEHEIPLARIQRIYGKTLDKMDNHDLAKLAAQCSSVNDNMITADECWPPEDGASAPEPKKVEKKADDTAEKEKKAAADKAAADKKKKAAAAAKAKAEKEAAEAAAAEEEEGTDAAEEPEEETDGEPAADDSEAAEAEEADEAEEAGDADELKFD